MNDELRRMLKDSLVALKILSQHFLFITKARYMIIPEPVQFISLKLFTVALASIPGTTKMSSNPNFVCIYFVSCMLSLPKCYHFDVVGEPGTPNDPESGAGGSLSSWQGHPSR
jgi:hypothetical protein